MYTGYHNCFWTASGELDCTSMNYGAPDQCGFSQYGAGSAYGDHSYHISAPGTQYVTQSLAQLNQNLGYVPRTCSVSPQSQPFGQMTHFSLPENNYQPQFQAQSYSCAGPTDQLQAPAPTTSGNWGTDYETVDFSYQQEMAPVQMPLIQYQQPVIQYAGSGSYGSGSELIPYGSTGQLYSGQSLPVATTPFNSATPLHTSSLLPYKVPTLIRELGQPDVMDSMLGGIAIWKERSLRDKLGGIFKRVEVHDEKVPNLNPPYIGNVYSWVKMAIKSSVFRDILDLFPNVWYDRQKRWLTVRTDTLDNNLATVALICLINRGTISARQVKQYDLQRKYMMSVNQNSRHFNRYSRAAFVNIIKKCALR
jgi:hypothetical protein